VEQEEVGLKPCRYVLVHPVDIPYLEDCWSSP
jgi:hypothetical protein